MAVAVPCVGALYGILLRRCTCSSSLQTCSHLPPPPPPPFSPPPPPPPIFAYPTIYIIWFTPRYSGPGQKHVLDNTIPGGPNNSKQILVSEPFIQNYTFHFWIASLNFSQTIFHVKKELFKMKFPLIVGYQIIECTHNSKKFQNSISKFKILINKIKKVKYA